jgi:carbon storage regulator CsrA
MLILSRKKREGVVIGRVDGSQGVITVTVFDISPERVKLGFTSDSNVSVHRGELHELARVAEQWRGTVQIDPETEHSVDQADAAKRSDQEVK